MSKRNIGDVFLLFHVLPFDFETDLPYPIAPGVFLDLTPHDVLSNVDPSALADFILPGYNVPGMPVTNCCLRAIKDQKVQSTPKPKDLLFLSVLGLRLQAPIAIQVAGKFELGDNDHPIQEPENFGMLSTWHPFADRSYSKRDLDMTFKILAEIIELTNLNEKRLMSAIILFSHASCGFAKSLQLAYLGLFSALEALFVPKGNKAKSLAKRTASFLSSFDADGSLESWVKNQYVYGRSKLAHGIQDVNPWIKLRKSKHDSYGKLHEIVRLSLLGFLSLQTSELVNLTKQSGNKLQQELDSLPPAKGAFMDGQGMWLS